MIASGETGVACGSSTGSTPDIKDFAAMMISNDASGLNANSYVRMMPHTTAANNHYDLEATVTLCADRSVTLRTLNVKDLIAGVRAVTLDPGSASCPPVPRR